MIKNEAVFTYFEANGISLLSSFLYKIDIYESDYSLTIELYFKVNRVVAPIKIRFTDIQEYSFYWNKGHFFYNVNFCKFFKKEDVFYISLDPFDETGDINDNDQDFIVCKGIEGYFDE